MKTEIINDLYIKNNITTYHLTHQSVIKKDKKLYNYLITRYKDSLSLSETIYRIFNNLEQRPVCLICGNPVKFIKFSIGFSKCCSKKCLYNQMRQTYVSTCIKKYGVNNTAKLDIVKNKEKLTILNKSIDEKLNILNKRRNTNLKIYGVENVFLSNYIKDKIKITMQLRYNVDYAAQSPNIFMKNKITSLLKYGTEFPWQNLEIKKKRSEQMSTIEILTKINETKKKNNSFHTSKVEHQFKEYLELNYPNDFEYQYRSELYPFNCDFYIKSLDLYIEINGSWTHGGHPFDENNLEDIDKLNLWKEKNTKFYNNAIKTWTIRDVNKRNIAKENKLNYLEIFSNNILDIIKIFNNLD